MLSTMRLALRARPAETLWLTVSLPRRSTPAPFFTYAVLIQTAPTFQYSPSAGLATNLPSGKVRHDIRDEKFTGLCIVPIANDQQVDAGVLVLPDPVDGLGHGAEKAAQRSARRQPFALRPYCGIVAAKSPGLERGLFDRLVIATRRLAMSAQHRPLRPHL